MLPFAGSLDQDARDCITLSAQCVASYLSVQGTSVAGAFQRPPFRYETSPELTEFTADIGTIYKPTMRRAYQELCDNHSPQARGYAEPPDNQPAAEEWAQVHWKPYYEWQHKIFKPMAFIAGMLNDPSYPEPVRLRKAATAFSSLQRMGRPYRSAFSPSMGQAIDEVVTRCPVAIAGFVKARYPEQAPYYAMNLATQTLA